MRLARDDLPGPVLETLRRGAVIPGHPLALTADRRWDVASQRALTRYYLDAGAGGLAVGVPTTQIAIREAGLYRPVLELAAETAASWSDRPLVMIAGAAGRTAQAVEEARTARGLGYHAVLLSLAALKGAGEDELVAHGRAVAAEMPLVGLHLQPAAGGMRLSRDFWARFAGLENVVAIQVAPFDRLATLDVCFGVAAAGQEDRVTLYTGNDDHVVGDLVTPVLVRSRDRTVVLRFRGGMLGQWSVWTRNAVALLARLQEAVAEGPIPPEILALDAVATDCGAVILDAANGFAGAVPGCHEILRRQGLMTCAACLDPEEVLSPGQAESIDRVHAAYPECNDDAFVRANLERWRA